MSWPAVWGGGHGKVVAIGDNTTRLRGIDQLEAGGARLVSIVHPSAILSPYAGVGVKQYLELGDIVMVLSGVAVIQSCPVAVTVMDVPIRVLNRNYHVE